VKVKVIKIWTREPELTDEMMVVGMKAAENLKRGIESGKYESSLFVFGSNANLSVWGKLGKSGQLSLMVYPD